jgi:hypothetical protein
MGVNRLSPNNVSALTNTALHASITAIDKSNSNVHQTHNGLSSAPFIDLNLTSTQKKSVQDEFIDDSTSPLNGHDHAIPRSKTKLKSIGGHENGTAKKESLSHEKSSTTCTIQ